MSRETGETSEIIVETLSIDLRVTNSGRDPMVIAEHRVSLMRRELLTFIRTVTEHTAGEAEEKYLLFALAMDILKGFENDLLFELVRQRLFDVKQKAPNVHET